MKILKRCKDLLILFLFIAVSLVSKGQSTDIPERPNPPRLVNDYAGFLAPGEQQQLEHKLVAFNDSTTTQIAIVIVKSLNGYDVNDMGSRIIQKWGIGQKDKNNGLLILVKPKTVDEKGQIAIVTGYGLEHLVTDALSKQIVESEIIPAFKDGQNYAGLDKAVNTLYSLTRGEFTPNQYLAAHNRHHKQTSHFPVVIIVILVFLAISIFGRSSSQSAGGLSSGGSGLPFWLLLGGLMGSGRSEGSWGSFSSGDNDFGGFGGGDSGGGGASGSW